MRGSVFGLTIAATGAAQLTGILTAGYLADRLSGYVLLGNAPWYLLAGPVILRGARQPSALTPKN